MLLSVGDHWAVNLLFLFDDDFIGMAANRLDSLPFVLLPDMFILVK